MFLTLALALAINASSPQDYQCFAAFGIAEDSPALGAGAEIEGFHCPAPGHPGDGTCMEWFNAPGPDVGACQAVYLSKSISITINP